MKTVVALTLHLTVSCDKCGYMLQWKAGPGRRQFMLHEKFGCERDGQTFEVPTLKLKRLS